MFHHLIFSSNNQQNNYFLKLIPDSKIYCLVCYRKFMTIYIARCLKALYVLIYLWWFYINLTLLSFLLLESCFCSSLTHRKPPLFCQEGYLRHHGVTHHSQPRWNHHDTLIMPLKQTASKGKSGADPTFSKYLAQAGTLFSSGLKIEL